MAKPAQSKARRRIGGSARKTQASTTTRVTPGAKKPATAASQNANLYLGGRLRHARLVQGLSLREVAAMVEVSEGYVSKLENDKVRPSLGTLHRLANVLQTNIGALVSESGPFDRTVTVIRLEERPVLQFAGKRRGEGVSLEKLIPSLPESLLQANVHVVEPGGASEDLIRHNGQEFGLVLEGELQLIVADKTYEIRVGDAFSFDSDRPHGYRNLGKATARILWINTPPTF
jgi:transcriptional regulator with XRE-family HTH domain